MKWEKLFQIVSQESTFHPSVFVAWGSNCVDPGRKWIDALNGEFLLELGGCAASRKLLKACSQIAF